MQTAAPTNRRQYTEFLIFIAILGAFSSLVNDMYLPTLPSMMREFHTTPSITQLGLSAVMAGLGIGSAIWGSLSDRYGRKPILLISLAIFAAGTAVSIFSPSIYFFIVCRLFQGIGAGGAMVLSYSIPADRYTGRSLAGVMAVVGAINGIFVLLLLIGAGMWIWARHRPESLPPEHRLQTAGIRQYMKAYGVLLRNGRFMIYVMIKSIGIGLLFAYIASAPFIIQDHYGFSAFEFGLIFGGNAIAIALGSMLVMKFKVLKHGLITGCFVMIAFALGTAFVMYHANHFLAYEAMAIPMLAGSGMVFSSANSLGMDVGRNDAGTAAAILNVIKYIFAAIVSPLAGIGNIMHSSAIAFVCIAILALAFVIPAMRLRPLADMVKN
ncbi:MAG: MFS transporter [Muribaculaceae bacterium]|nr:MFS transporter [Muribaculaceae bacterium]